MNSQSNFFLHKKNQQRGAALIIVILFFITISISVVLSATIGAIVELRTYRTLVTSKVAYVAAEAGIEDIFFRTIREKSIPASQTLILSGATSTVTVVDVSATQRDIYATGNSKNEIRKIYLSILKNQSVSFPYGAQVGEGGITLKQNARIDGTGLALGDIYSDGQIVGASGVVVTGNAISASGLVGDQIASSTVCSTDEVVGRTNPNIDYAQSFQMSGTSSAELAKVTLYVKRNGNATGANIRIVADSAGVPSTTALASQAMLYSSVSTTYGWVDVVFSAPATLNPGTTYWIILDATQDNGKYWYWCRSAIDSYATGTALYKQVWNIGGAWTGLAGDLAFKVTFGGGVSKIDDVNVSGLAKADAITDSTIGGDAYYQTISGSTVSGTAYPGSPTPPYVPLPLSTTTINQWKEDAASGGVINGDCGIGGLPECDTLPLFLGPKRINGDFNLDGGNDPAKVLTLTGTLYVTGNLVVENQGKIKCDFAYLGNSCVVIVDGTVNINNNAVLSGSGSSGSFVLILSTKEGCLGSGGVGCTINDSAIAIENNVDGALFYTTDSLIDISNGVTITAVVGYMIQLQNNAEILYDSTVAGLSFAPSATTTTGAWNAIRWSEF